MSGEGARVAARPSLESGGSVLLYLSVGLLVVAVIITCLAGVQALFYGVDVRRGVAVQPRRRPSDVMLYVLTAVGIVCIIAGIWGIHNLGGG